MADEWMDIESAPKDGTYLFLSDGHRMRIGWWRKGADYECHGSIGGGWGDMASAEAMGPSDLRFAPTHYQPLPLPPAAVERNDDE